jgi:dTDP-4-dehydrorhamnose 3,5-epimerase
MNVVHKPINFKDKRGLIQDIFIGGKFDHATYIFMKRGGIRGNHYHKKTVQYMFVIEGKVEYYYSGIGEKAKKVVLKPGDFIETPAFECHAVRPVKDTKVLVLARGPRGGDGYEDDTYRLEIPIVVKSR